MRLIPPSRSTARLWVLLFVAFLVVGLSAGIATLHLALEQYTSDLRTDLLNTARLMSLSVDANDHERLQTFDDMQGATYKRLAGELAQAQRGATDVHFVHTFRRGPDGSFVFVLDPSASFDRNQDGMDSRRYLLDPYPEISSTAKRCFDTGNPTVESTCVTDRRGTFWNAYAPLIDKQGKVAGVLEVQRDASSITKHLAALYRVGYIGLALVIGLGLLFSILLARGLERRLTARDGGPPLRSPRTIRVAILELVMVGLAFSVLLMGVTSFVAVGNLRGDRDRAVQRAALMADWSHQVDNLAYESTPNWGELVKLQSEAGHLGMSWVPSMVSSARAAGSNWRAELRKLSVQVDLERQKAGRTRQKLDRDLSDEQDVFSVAFAVAIALGLASMAFIWSAVRHHQQLIAAQAESEELKNAYQQIADHLPIGLFMIRRGEIVFSNAAWDKQVLRQPNEDRLEAMRRALDPQDRDMVLGGLFATETHHKPVDLRYQLVRETGDPRTMESHAVAVKDADGGFDHLLGFVIDVSGRVSAQKEAQVKQAEAEAKSVMLQIALTDLEVNFQAMVHALVKAVEAKDPYTAGHSERVTGYSVRIGELLGLAAKDLRILELGTLIHDVGKIGIPDEILLKPGRLDPDEYEAVRAHPSIGADMVEKIPLFKPCIPIIRWHHERLNGSGYPDRLTADAIPTMVRIAMVADAFDAMTSSRAYRGALDAEAALQELRDEAKQGGLDPEVVEALADIVKRDGILWTPPAEKAA